MTEGKLAASSAAATVEQIVAAGSIHAQESMKFFIGTTSIGSKLRLGNPFHASVT
jgi:hypothetical protein